VAEDLEDADLAGDSFDVRLLDDLLLLEGLHGHLLAGVHVDAELDLAEGALADVLA
jgi:hypothetical protein